MSTITRVGWTDEEEKILKENYERATIEKLEALLPRYSITQIRSKANKLGLKRKAPRPSRKNVKLKRWTDEEIENLKNIYSTTNNDDLAKVFSRFNPREIKRKANTLRLEKTAQIEKIDEQLRKQKMAGETRWKEEEDTILRENYPTLGQTGTQRLLPHRPIGSIRSRVNRLGLTKVTSATWKRISITPDNKDVFSIEIIYERVDV
ncbi:hypothetical protein CIL05_07845 [Virgibacillus profundi]|uniref:Myb-like domain-containing protein n=1 Tax=Virgibacillus profundi TaxID=2024555 RepID=A0A2A2IGK3_9BACI|nr:hypothetical protein [Virgibacillus profundi]PAV30374.1 hypothetical protein CIL05_07845 [Virgibacillus profundi]PXY54546.1 hypothetical protein CIT14_07930 [Virgibacillus profundi]